MLSIFLLQNNLFKYAKCWPCPKYCCLQNALSLELQPLRTCLLYRKQLGHCVVERFPQWSYVSTYLLQLHRFQPSLQSFQNMLLTGALILVLLLPRVCTGQTSVWLAHWLYSGSRLNIPCFINNSLWNILTLLLSTYLSLPPPLHFSELNISMYHSIIWCCMVYLFTIICLLTIGFMRSNLLLFLERGKIKSRLDLRTWP